MISCPLLSVLHKLPSSVSSSDVLFLQQYLQRLISFLQTVTLLPRGLFLLLVCTNLVVAQTWKVQFLFQKALLPLQILRLHICGTLNALEDHVIVHVAVYHASHFLQILKESPSQRPQDARQHIKLYPFRSCSGDPEFCFVWTSCPTW